MIADAQLPAEFGRYRIEALISSGGMGVVYRARHRGLARVVALKLIHPVYAADPQFRKRFQREAMAAAALDHPHILPIHDAGECEDRLYLDMRYVAGTDLRRLIADAGRLEPRRAVALVAQLAAALDAAHGAGLVHRDVKPANVLVESRAGGEHAYLTDFGIAKHGTGADTQLTRAGQWLGTPDYAPPEQILGAPVDGRADVYALGGLLFHALSGHAPFAGHASKEDAHLSAAAPSLRAELPELPDALDQAIGRALAKAPAERFDSAGALAQTALRALESAPPPPPLPLTGAFTRAPRESPDPEPLPPPRRRRLAPPQLVVVAMAVVALAGATGGAIELGAGPHRPGAGVTDGRDVPLRPLEVGARVTGAAISDGVLWALDESDQRAVRIDLRTGARRAVDVGEATKAIGAGPAGVWVADAQGDLRSLDAGASGTLFGEGADGIAVARDAVWVLDAANERVRHITPGSPPVDTALPGGLAVASDGDSVWVLDREGLVKRVSAGGLDSVGGPTGVTGSAALAAGGGALWILDRTTGTVLRLDLRTRNQRVFRADLGVDVRSIAYAAGALWVVAGDGTVTPYPATG